MTIDILDYGMGNLRSVQKGFERTGAEARIVTSSRQVGDSRALVVPGVGAFRQCMENLATRNLLDPIHRHIAAGKPFLGICLGLQVLFTASDEFGTTPGLDIIKGRVRRFPAKQPAAESGPVLKIPHMGWNTITKKKDERLLADVPDGSHLYFVHSYYVQPDDSAVVATTTFYGVEFTSSIRSGNIFACQFHPEKSQHIGLSILKRFSEASGG